jgi:hypothetical protein
VAAVITHWAQIACRHCCQILIKTNSMQDLQRADKEQMRAPAAESEFAAAAQEPSASAATAGHLSPTVLRSPAGIAARSWSRPTACRICGRQIYGCRHRTHQHIVPHAALHHPHESSSLYLVLLSAVNCAITCTHLSHQLGMVRLPHQNIVPRTLPCITLVSQAKSTSCYVILHLKDCHNTAPKEHDMHPPLP